MRRRIGFTMPYNFDGLTKTVFYFLGNDKLLNATGAKNMVKLAF